MKAKREDLEAAEEELAEVQAARAALRASQSVPFVWDIAFVEIFEDDEKGFGIVIGNPPYVRQEMIAPPQLREEDFKPDAWREKKKEYKAQLQQAVAEAFPKFFNYKHGSDKFRKLDGKSDLYIYFYLLGLKRLNPNGAFCFITSNSWLDVGYGKDLQEFLLTQSHVKMILDNQAKRSFKQADVNTIIALLAPPHAVERRRINSTAQQVEIGSKPIQPDSSGLNLVQAGDSSPDRIARFVMFRTPFENVLSPVIFQEIEQARERKSTPEYRVTPIRQQDLLAEGMAMPEDEEGTQKRGLATASYEGGKWGGRYLRAPDIFFTILEKGKGKLVRLGEIAQVRRGFTTGANEFFYLDDATIEKWGIEKEFLKPVIKSPRDYYCITLPTRVATQLFWCQKDKRALKGTGALKYIEWGEKQGFHKVPSCRSRPLWYALNGPLKPTMLWPSAFFERFICYECPKGFVADKVFYTITGDLSVATKAFLNSSVVALFIEVDGYQLNHGGIFVTTEWLGRLPVLVEDVPGLTQAYKSLAKRDIKLYGNEVIEPDRITLDKEVLKALDLPDSLISELHRVVTESVLGRIVKARRNITQKGRQQE